jgi:hypothetical protein
LKKLKCTNRVSNTLSFSFLFGAFSKKVMVLSTAIYHHFQHIKKDAIWFPCIESGCMISFGNLQCLKHPLTQQKVEASSAAPENRDSGNSSQATVFRVIIIFSMLAGASAPELPPGILVETEASHQSISATNSYPFPFFYSLGFRLEEFGSSGSAGSSFSNHLPAYPPQREACEEITPGTRLGQTISPCESPRDRPDPMKE